ncbi:MAG: putative Integrator complex subunit 11 [Streblomastix strix]|uniref:Putative Integrator complex subunit 11 n=1 Tax=Streblomastix strix TaxID=222440 RepID=A0A5J4W591_9EUKA|nr:MAG: putative Integrator complex subunit 11 [Streblomastix strix]
MIASSSSSSSVNKEIKILALGAGQEVGRSCIIVKMGGKTIMLDCGSHPVYEDQRRFPDFTLIKGDKQSLDDIIDCCLISHFHLDHTGGLPYFTEHVGYSKPIFMSYPTRDIVPHLLEDYRKLAESKQNERRLMNKDKDDKQAPIYTQQEIERCMSKIVPMKYNETKMYNGIEISTYLVGHVLGAELPRCFPNVLITETTYGTTIRSSRLTKEENFLDAIVSTVNKGGKVLIPVFALGRVQELCLIADRYWSQNDMTIPIYYTQGLAARAMPSYRQYTDWMNESVQEQNKIKTEEQRKEEQLEYEQWAEAGTAWMHTSGMNASWNMGDRKTASIFDYEHVLPYQAQFLHADGPMVLFAAPGMLNGGISQDALRLWGVNERNLVILPGYCADNTIGGKLLKGERDFDVISGQLQQHTSNYGREKNRSKSPSQKYDKRDIRRDHIDTIHIKCPVLCLPFSAHADALGLAMIVQQTMPDTVALVHGELDRISYLQNTVFPLIGCPCYSPQIGIECKISIPEQ